jgi:hypothetical protein
VFVVIVLTLPGGLINLNEAFSERAEAVFLGDYRP